MLILSTLSIKGNREKTNESLYKTNSPHRFQNAPYMNNITEVKLHVEYIILWCRKQMCFDEVRLTVLNLI